MDDQLEQELMEAEEARELSRIDEDSASIVYKPEFAQPFGLTEDGQKAWSIVIGVLAKENISETGLNRQVFHSSREWQAEVTGVDSELIIAHDGGGHAPYFNLDYGACLSRSTMDRALQEAGFYIETQTPMYSAICKLPTTDQDMALLEQVLGGDDEDALDREDAAEIKGSELSFILDVQRILQSMGFTVTEMPDLRNRPAAPVFFKAVMQIGTDSEQARDIAWNAVDELKQQLGLDVSFVNHLDQHDGLWHSQFYIPRHNFTAEALGSEEDFDVKDVAEPDTKLERIRRLFTTMGLHISGMTEVPADPRWGQLGEPYRTIDSVLQPDGTRHWTTDGVSGQELKDFIRRVQTNLGEILDTPIVDFTTKFDRHLDAWKITWRMGDPDITQHNVVESDDEEADLVKDVELVDFQPGDIVRVPTSHWPDMRGRITHKGGYVYGDPKNVMWWVEWGKHPSLDGTVRTSDLELVERPEPLTNPLDTVYPESQNAQSIVNRLLEDEQEDIDLAKEVGLTPPARAKMPSGVEGWQDRLQNVYSSFEEFESYSELYGLATRLGFQSAEDAWRANPVIRGSVNAADFGVVAETATGTTTGLTLMHGTSTAHLSAIQQRGLEYPYLTNNPEVAEYYAQAAVDADGGSPAVLRVRVPDTAELRADIPSFQEPLHFVYKKYARDEKEWYQALNDGTTITWPENDADWQTSLRVVGSVIYYGTVEPINIQMNESQEGSQVQAHQDGTTLWLDWISVPEPRLAGEGRRVYQQWEASIPADIRLVRLFAADSGEGRSAGFWEKMGFSYVYSSKRGDESDFEMWKGVNGHPAPESIREHSENGDDDRVAIVGVFRKKDEGYEVLVARREVDPEAGKWCIPGGHARVGEGIMDGARREMEEETHLELDDLTFIKKMRNEERNADVYVYGTMLPEGDRPKAGDDAEKIKWVPIDDLPELAFDNDKLIDEIAEKMELTVQVEESDGGKPPWYDPKVGAQKVKHDVEGAPVKIGQSVKVTSIGEGEEDTDWGKLMGQTGTVSYLEYSCGCGQTYPQDPMIGVQFTDGSIHEFWHEELEPIVQESLARPLGSLIADQMAYLESVRPKLDEARLKAAAAETDPQRKESLEKGHGRYLGSCGHVIQQCRCMSKNHPGTIQVEALCEKCSKENAQIKLAESDSGNGAPMARFNWLIREDKAHNKFGKNGFLIVFEGIDGAGKTTQVKRLAEWLNDKDYSYITTKWNSSKLLSDTLWKAKRKKMLTPMTFSMLHASDMHIRYENIIIPALKKQKVVICDRYYYTSYVRDKIRDIDDGLLDIVYKDFRKPDLIFFCEVPVKVAVERLLSERGVGYYSSGQDVGYGTKGIEKTTEKYEEDMAQRYEKLFKGEPHVVRLDMTQSIKDIAKDIKREVKKYLGMDQTDESLDEAVGPDGAIGIVTAQGEVNGVTGKLRDLEHSRERLWADLSWRYRASDKTAYWWDAGIYTGKGPGGVPQFTSSNHVPTDHDKELVTAWLQQKGFEVAAHKSITNYKPEQSRLRAELHGE